MRWNGSKLRKNTKAEAEAKRIADEKAGAKVKRVMDKVKEPTISGPQVWEGDQEVIHSVSALYFFLSW